MADGEGEMHMQNSPTVEKLEMQFEELRSQLEDSGKLRERIRAVAMEIESTTWLMHSSLLLIHHSISISGAFLSST